MKRLLGTVYPGYESRMRRSLEHLDLRHRRRYWMAEGMYEGPPTMLIRKSILIAFGEEG
jgi:hypothetical protein